MIVTRGTLYPRHNSKLEDVCAQKQATIFAGATLNRVARSRSAASGRSGGGRGDDPRQRGQVCRVVQPPRLEDDGLDVVARRRLHRRHRLARAPSAATRFQATRSRRSPAPKMRSSRSISTRSTSFRLTSRSKKARPKSLTPKHPTEKSEYTAVHVRRDGKWMLDRVTDTDIEEQDARAAAVEL